VNYSVSVLMGNGDGTFAAQQTAGAGRAPIAVAVGDLNGDGVGDLVVANNMGGTVSTLLGNGDGTFKAQRTYTVGAIPSSVAISDFNSDGRLDVVVANAQSPGGVSVLLGNGNGTLQLQLTFATGAVPESVAVSDFNRDGRVDLVTADLQGGSLSVLLSNGNGTFQSNQTYSVGSFPFSASVSDVNGDGRMDLLVANEPAGTVGVLTGNGNGTFGAQQTYAIGKYPFAVVGADVSGDGRTDLVAANEGAKSVSVLLGNSGGNFNGQSYTVLNPETILGTSGDDAITLTKDGDGTHIDWSVGLTSLQIAINDPNGLTIWGNGGNDTITLNYANGNPLPNTVHFNGTFTINNLGNNQTVANPLANTNFEIGRSTLFVNYGSAAADAATKALIKTYLAGGYNGGAWTGVPTASTGVITSTPAKNNVNHNTAIGWADSSDGTGVNTTANTIELKYTLAGDATLNGAVDIFDLNALLPNFNAAGDWTSGDSTYTGTVDIFDLNALLPNFNTTLGAQLTPATAGATPAAAATVNNSSAPSTAIRSILAPAPPRSSTTAISTSMRGSSLMPVGTMNTPDDSAIKKGVAGRKKKDHTRRI
jgi:hypothetical protein